MEEQQESAPAAPLTPPAPPSSRSSRTPRLVVLAVTAVAVLLVMAAALVLPEAVRQEPAGPVTLDAVQEWDLDQIPTTHVEGDVDYDQDPPIGGPHNPVWLDCGAYDTQVRAENLVHDLEHGTVFLAYDPDLGADDVAALEAQLPQNGIMSPWADLTAPVVAIVWGRRLDLDGPDDPRLALFLLRYGDGETAPEPFASCAGGLDDPAGTGDEDGGGVPV